MKTKKEVILSLLQKIQSKRALAANIMVLIKNVDEDSVVVGTVLNLMSHALHQTKSHDAEKILEHSIQVVKKIQEKEEQEIISEADLDNLLADV
jgi:hypothetical protein